MSPRTPMTGGMTASRKKKLGSQMITSVAKPMKAASLQKHPSMKKLPPLPLAPNRENTLSFASKWTYGVLTVAASIVFGIWAPLLYKMTASGNASNNDAQSSVMNAMLGNGKLAAVGNEMASTANDMALDANNVASEALSAAVAQSTTLAAMETRLALMGQLAMIDFCDKQFAIEACDAVNMQASVMIQSLLDGLLYSAIPSLGSAQPSPASASASTSASTYAPVPLDNALSGGATDSPFPTAVYQTIAVGSVTANEFVTIPQSITWGLSQFNAPVSSTSWTPATTTLSMPSTTAASSTISTNITTGVASGNPVTTSPPIGATPARKHSGSGSTIPVDAILGIVFGMIGLVGAALGFMVWRLRRQRLVSGEDWG